MSKYSIQLGYQDIRTNNEDFVLTPFLFLVNTKETKIVKVLGIGICWLNYSFYIAIGKNVPKELRGFNNHNKK